jgi:hypothetical protein
LPFDPRNPLPRPTIRAIRASGPGQASPARLRLAAVGGGVAAVGLYALLDDWWLAGVPLALCAFGCYGLALQATHALDIAHARAPARRGALRLVRVAAVTVGVAAWTIALLMALGTTVEWEPLMDALGR